MLTQLSYLINKTVYKKKNVLFFRPKNEIAIKFFDALNTYQLFVLNSNNEKWDYDLYPTNTNVQFIDNLVSIQDIDFAFTILPHNPEIYNFLKSFTFLPKVSLFDEILDRKPSNQDIINYGELCLTPSKEILEAWELNEKGKIVKDWNSKTLKQTIDKFYESITR